jgi:hypothetical protein
VSYLSKFPRSCNKTCFTQQCISCVLNVLLSVSLLNNKIRIWQNSVMALDVSQDHWMTVDVSTGAADDRGREFL